MKKFLIISFCLIALGCSKAQSQHSEQQCYYSVIGMDSVACYTRVERVAGFITLYNCSGGIAEIQNAQNIIKICR